MKPNSKSHFLSAAEKALAVGKIVTAGRKYKTWRRVSRGSRGLVDRARGHLLACHLELLAGRARASRWHLRCLEEAHFLPSLVLLEARHLALEGHLPKAIKLLSKAVGKLHPGKDLELKALFVRELGKLCLDSNDILGGQSYLVEAARLFSILGKKNEEADVRIDLAESYQAFGDNETALKTLPPNSRLTTSRRSRVQAVVCRSQNLRDRKIPADLRALGKLDTLESAQHVIAVARYAFEAGEADFCLQVLDTVKEAGWFGAVAEFRAEKAILMAEIKICRGEYKEASAIIHNAENQLPPGILGKIRLATDWQLLRIAEGTGDFPEALRICREIRKTLEHRRLNLWACRQLRSLSDSYLRFYRLSISLELRCGRPKEAFEALQEFTARSLLRLGSRGAPQCLESNLPGVNFPSQRDHAGQWSLRRLLRPLGASRAEALPWERVITTLRRLSSEYDD